MTVVEILKNSVIVAAHPDDEVLWFSSILKRVDHIVLCFPDEIADPDFGERRRKAVLNYPLQNISSLELASFGVWRPQSFISPRFNKYGIEITGDGVTYSAHTKKYEENYYELKRKLTGVLSKYQNVITHNPWGEYGHAEHIQVYRVVSELQKEMGFDLWYSNYCSNVTIGLVTQHMCVADKVMLFTDADIAKELKKFYEINRCWAWHKDWQWPIQETFVKDGYCASSDISNMCLIIPLNLILMPQVSPQISRRPSMLKRLKARARKMSRWVSKRD